MEFFVVVVVVVVVRQQQDSEARETSRAAETLKEQDHENPIYLYDEAARDQEQ